MTPTLDLWAHEWVFGPQKKSGAATWRLDNCKKCGLLRYFNDNGDLPYLEFKWYFMPGNSGGFYETWLLPQCKKGGGAMFLGWRS